MFSYLQNKLKSFFLKTKTKKVEKSTSLETKKNKKTKKNYLLKRG
jgi:hypothetical protein